MGGATAGGSAAADRRDAQTWLALNNLTVDAKCRAKYRYDDHRKNTMNRLKRFFNDILLDQLLSSKICRGSRTRSCSRWRPRTEDAGSTHPGAGPGDSHLLLKRTEEWIACARAQLSSHFADTPETRAAAMSRFEDMSKMFEFMREMETRAR